MAMKSGLASDSGFAHRTSPRPTGAVPAAPPDTVKVNVCGSCGAIFAVRHTTASALSPASALTP